MPSVQPAPEFRRKLHQALERTHRQHAAQRALGTRRVYTAAPPRRWPWALLLIALCAVAVLMASGRRRRA